MRQVRAKKLRKITKNIHNEEMVKKGISFKQSYNIIKEQFKKSNKVKKEKNENFN